MGVLDVFKKKKKEEVTLPIPETRLPEDLERFRMEREPIGPVETPSTPPPERAPMRDFERFPEYPGSSVELKEAPIKMPEEQKTREGIDKIDMILQKLETIDARLKLLEEKLRR